MYNGESGDSEMTHDREREVLAKIQKAHRTLEFLVQRNGNIRTPVRNDIERYLDLADRFVVNKGDRYFPHEYWVKSADENVSMALAIMHVTGWVHHDYEFGVGWQGGPWDT